MKKQAYPGPSVPITPEELARTDGTYVYWLSSAGMLVNCRGTKILIDPVLELKEGCDPAHPVSEVRDLPLLFLPPITPQDLGKIDAVLYTHADFDHLGITSPVHLLESGAVYHTTGFVARELEKLGVPADRIVVHHSQDEFTVGPVSVRMTLADHCWQVLFPDEFDWFYTVEDCTGFYLTTPDGTIWNPGDSRLLPAHLVEQTPDLLMMDYSDDSFHFGRKNSLKLSNRHLASQIIMFHWGTYGENENCYNADPADVRPYLQNPERLHILQAGVPYKL